MQTKDELLDLIKRTIITNGRYLTLKELRDITGVGYSRIYKAIPEGLSGINESLGFYPPTKWSRDDLISKITDYIRSVGAYCTPYNIACNAGISRSTISSYNVDIPSINKSLGYLPSKCNSNRPISAGYNELSKSSVDDRYSLIVSYIKNKGHSSTRKELENALSLPSGFIKKVDMNVVHAQAGVVFSGMKRHKDTSTLITDIVQLIEEEGRYVPSMTISEKLGVSASLLHHRGINTQALNESLGFIKDNGYFEYSVLKALQEVFPNTDVIRQKWFDKCVSPLGNKLYFDFYIPDYNLLVEADGPGHFDEGHPWYTEIGLERDAIKNRYCSEAGINLCRVPYSISITKEYVLQQLSGTPLEIGKLQHS